MEAKPLQIVSSSHNNNSGVGGGPQMKIEGGVVDEEKKGENSSPNVELDIGVGASSAAPQEEAINPVITACHQKYCLFSEAQRRELDHQVFIFNQFAHNLHLPLQFPSHMSEYSGLGFDYGTMVDDPEPHRCRRTDGKKWRCSKNTVPHQKYCERHMHRGRNRSRKPVETSSQVNSPLTTKPCGNKSHAKPAPNTESAVSSPNIVTIHDTPSTQSRSFCVANTSSVNSRSRNAVGSSEYQTPFSPAVVVTPGSTLATAIAPKVTTFSSMASITSHYRSHVNVHTKDEQNMSCIISNKMSIKSSGKGSIVCDSISNGISTGIGVSPRSVLQGNHSYLNGRNNIESEAGRCRRTDGKKWRCKGGVLPGQKYCATHMHRGAKKRFTDHEPATTSALSVYTARLPYPSATTNVQKAPNTNLSMSVPASAAAAFTQCNEKSASGSDTDTTISDTINECNYLSF